jgi:hypothetical protein
MSSDSTMASLLTANRPPDPPPPINSTSPSVGGIDSLEKGQDPSIIAGENPISKPSIATNDIEEVNMMDWDSDDVTVLIPSEEQIQIAQTNLAKETSAAKSTGESPASKAPICNPYAAGSCINRLIPISVFITIIVHPEIDGILRENFAAIFATDEEGQILPRGQTSREPTLTKGSDLNNKTLRPIYATMFLKRLPDGGKKYEFYLLMQQGNMHFHDLRYEDPVKVALRDFNMQWTASNIIGSDRVCIGWIFGKHPDACTMSNFKQALRKDMPKDAPDLTSGSNLSPTTQARTRRSRD